MPAGEADTIEDRPVGTGYLLAAGLALGFAVTNGLSRFAYGLVLPAMRDVLGWNYTQSGWINTANALGYLAGAIFAFRVTHRFNPHRLFAANLWATTAAMLATGLTSHFMLLTVLRFAAGAGSAVVVVVGSVLVANIFVRDAARSTIAFAIYFAGGGAAIVSSGVTIPWLFAFMGHASWPYAWIGMGVVSIALTFLAIRVAGRVSISKIEWGNRGWMIRPFLPAVIAYGIFGAGHIAYMTFVITWLHERGAAMGEVASFWATLGAATMLAPIVWSRALAQWPGGLPLAVVLLALAVGGALPLWQITPGFMLASALIFGGAVFVAPTAVVAFLRKALPPNHWNEAIAGATTFFALCQCVGPVLSGALSDEAGSLFAGLGFSAILLLLAAGVALMQRDITA